MISALFIVLTVYAIWVKRSYRPRNALERSGVFLMSLALIVVTMTICQVVSQYNRPADYEPVDYYAETEDGICCDKMSYVKDANKYYKATFSNRMLWLPGAAYDYEEVDTSKNFCNNCEVFCNLDYCVLCDQQLRGCRCECEKHETLIYCGECGKEIGKEN